MSHEYYELACRKKGTRHDDHRSPGSEERDRLGYRWGRLKMESRLYRIEGRVQGVWFRESTRREAEALGITGYAQNVADGSVRVLACGDPAALDRLAQWLHQGPPLARVHRVELIGSPDECPASFTTT